MKIKCHSQYNHFPIYGTDQDDCDLELWNDGKIWEYLEKYPDVKRGSALLIEPRSLQPGTYILVESSYDIFDNVFTHDSQLLSLLPNAYPIFYYRDYELNDEKKTKKISFICGEKEMCSYHIIRKKIAEVVQDKVDVLGDWNGGNRVSTHDAHAPYKFAIVVENYIDDLWFTEKILNCFANKTVPIYYGAREICNYFNKNGIIQVSNIWQIPDLIDEYYDYFDEMYDLMKYAIEDNYERVQKYKNFEDWFIKHYGEAKNVKDINNE